MVTPKSQSGKRCTKLLNRKAAHKNSQIGNQRFIPTLLSNIAKTRKQKKRVRKKKQKRKNQGKGLGNLLLARQKDGLSYTSPLLRLNYYFSSFCCCSISYFSINEEGNIPFSTKLAAGLRSVARNNKATRLLTRPG